MATVAVWPISQLLLEEKARHLLSRKLDFVPNPDFATVSPDTAESWLGPAPGEVAYWAKKARSKAPSEALPRLAEHYLWPLLTKDQEQHLFRKYNYTKFLADLVRKKVAQGELSLVSHAFGLQEKADALRSWLWSANQRIVVKIARRFAARLGKDLFDLLSDGDVSLLAAVEKFDFSFGYKFSTYAYWAVTKNFARAMPANSRKLVQALEDSDDETYLSHEEEAPDALSRVESAQSACRSVGDLLAYLEPRERSVIQLRNGIGTGLPPMTLQEIGSHLHVTKERARQIENTAKSKLFVIARNVGNNEIL